jgi:hypothetical protein
VLAFASAETLAPPPNRRDRRPPATGGKPLELPAETTTETEPVPEVMETKEVEMVMYRTGGLDRMLAAIGDPPEERPATIANPVDRDYPELAELTAQELTGRITGGKEGTELVVYRTGRLDRTLSDLGSEPDKRPATVGGSARR